MEEIQIKEISQNELDVSISDIQYTFKFITLQSDMYITIINKTTSPIFPFSYQVQITLDNIKRKYRYFNNYTSIKQLQDDFISLIKNKHFSFRDNKTCIILTFSPSELKNDNIKYIIPQTEFQHNEVISSLAISLSQIMIKYDNINKENIELKNEIQTLKQENEYYKKNILPQMKSQIETILNYLEEEKQKKYEKLEGDIENSNIIIKDVKERQLISTWIAPCQKITTKLLYKATKDGDKAETFHKLCDNKGPTLILIKSTKGNRFGGYTSVNWESPNDYQFKTDSDAFIFSLDKKKKYKTTKEECSIYCSCLYGPGFGDGCDLIIDDNSLTSTLSHTNVPCTYKINYDFELSGGERNFTVSELEVYQIMLLL